MSEERKRKISVELQQEDEVVGPIPAGAAGNTKKRKGSRPMILIGEHPFLFLDPGP